MKLSAKIASLSLCVLLLAATGCGSSSSSEAASSPSAAPAESTPAASTAAPAAVSQDSNLMERAAKLLTADGREYDKLFTGQMNEQLTSNFFDFSITGAEVAAELEGYAPQQEGYQFLVADVTVHNIFGEPIPVGNYDFYVIWNGGTDVAYESFFDGMYPDEVELGKDETLSGKLVFEIPADATDIMVGYDEIWDDEFVGNSFMVSIAL